MDPGSGFKRQSRQDNGGEKMGVDSLRHTVSVSILKLAFDAACTPDPAGDVPDGAVVRRDESAQIPIGPVAVYVNN